MYSELMVFIMLFSFHNKNKRLFFLYGQVIKLLLLLVIQCAFIIITKIKRFFFPLTWPNFKNNQNKNNFLKNMHVEIKKIKNIYLNTHYKQINFIFITIFTL